MADESGAAGVAGASGAVKSMDDIMSLCKRRGFIYQASEIYGGINGFWDYGPLGAMLKKNLREAWWRDVVMTGCRGKKGPGGQAVRVVPVDTCIIQNPKVWEASGHIAGFNDPMVDDKETKQRFRADHFFGVWKVFEGSMPPGRHRNVNFAGAGTWCTVPFLSYIASTASEAFEAFKADKKNFKRFHVHNETVDADRVVLNVRDRDRSEYKLLVAPIVATDLEGDRANDIPSPFTQQLNCLTEPRQFNLMFSTTVGATGDTEKDKAYLRPETAQGIFINFKNVVDTTRVRIPFGIGQTGKAFRNEVTPRNFTFRSREFEQMEIEFFCHPDEAQAWYTFWRDWRMAWWESIGLKGENLILREHDADELSHYSTGTSDVEYRFPFTAPGYGELEGIANRGCFDLTQHQEHSGAKMEYFDQEKNERFMPHVIEPSAGLDRGVLALLCEAYTPDESRPSKVYMKFHPRMAPIKAAVYPLVNKDGMPEKATELYDELVAKFGHLGLIEYDAKQNIGKRYARMDEAGCPYCFTIDGETLTDGTVTMRDRDSATQTRIALTDVSAFLAEKLGV